MLMKRRNFLRGLAAFAALATFPRMLLAAWPEKAFKAKTLDESLAALFGGTPPVASDQVNLKIPDIAENGAVVPVTVSTDMPDVESISVLVANNPNPLAASFELSPGTNAEVSTRIKMGQSSDVIGVVKTKSGAFMTRKEVKVTIGGCGG